MPRASFVVALLALSSAAASAQTRQGLTAQEENALYHLAEGDEAFPLVWLKALEDSTTKRPFLENPERYGGLPDPAEPNGLPVGAGLGVPSDLQWAGVRMVGIQCAGCHVGEVRYNGKSMRILGGPSFFFGNQFGALLTSSIANTARHPQELMKFVLRVIDLEKLDKKGVATTLPGVDAATLKAHLAEVVADTAPGSMGESVRSHLGDVLAGKPPTLTERVRAAVSGFRARVSSALHRLDPVKRVESMESLVKACAQTARLLEARLKALKKGNDPTAGQGVEPGPGRADAFGSLLHGFYASQGVPAPYAPTSYPAVWETRRTPWYHYDAGTNAILQRNAGQALALGIVVDPKTSASTLQLRSLNAIESSFWKLSPPVWPQQLLGPIDAAKKARGQQLYQQQCASCHTAREFQLAELAEVGTDPARLNAAASEIKDASGKSTPALYAAMAQLDGIIAAAAKRENVTADELHKMRFGQPDKVTWRITKKYRIPSLRGIWASAPYLHNGSVPTLYDLLQPASKRPAKFLVGSYNFDPVKVGFVTKAADPNHWELDATKAGNLNKGHEFGAQLSEPDRLALLEYLKTL
jgi:mono/diheme cytochrome c family protein